MQAAIKFSAGANGNVGAYSYFPQSKVSDACSPKLRRCRIGDDKQKIVVAVWACFAASRGAEKVDGLGFVYLDQPFYDFRERWVNQRLPIQLPVCFDPHPSILAPAATDQPGA